MRKVICAVAVLTITASSAWAGEAKRIERAARSTSGSSASAAAEDVRGGGDRASSRGEARSASRGDAVRDDDARPRTPDASHAERWLVEREGYRDGGY
jgi:hypothetical protein